MVSFYFYDSNGTLIRNIGAGDELPDAVAHMKISGPFDRNRSNCRFLTSMLKSSPRKLEKITIGGDLTTESPEFLAFLVLLCNKTNSLGFSECPISTNATSCLMGALLSCDGIRHLSISLQSLPLSTNQAKILFEGVASSTCLECFDLKVAEFSNREDAGTYLIQALERNQSLKKIALGTHNFDENDSTFMQKIVKASILGPNVKDVSIYDDGHLRLRFDDLQEVLLHKDCTIEKLHLDAVIISTGPGTHGSVVQNSSVTSLTVRESELSSLQSKGIISIFKSLEELDLGFNNIDALSFLDPLLLGERSQLKNLNVCCNRFDDEEMERFIEKLRKVKGLKHLAVGGNEWEDSESAKTALIDALRHSTDLEDVDFFCEDLPLALNRGGRRVFESPLQPFPTNLLPHVLERASKISYYRQNDPWGDPSNKEARADVVFWMIHRILPQL